MRELLSNLIAQSAVDDPNFMVLSGDHGYALFDKVRKLRGDQFINVGVAEQAMIGLAAGLCREGFRPLVYGLSSFVPIRVLEQIKIDICYSKLPVIMLGDGAGLVYSTLGASHQCGEDLACLRPMPNLRIYSPCDASELESCFKEAMNLREPTYIRIGKSDRPAVHATSSGHTDAHITHRGSDDRVCLVATGSMVSLAHSLAKELGTSCVSVPRLKPLGADSVPLLARFKKLIFLEEHSRFGGLYSTFAEAFCDHAQATPPKMSSLSLADRFGHDCGSYQFALSEHTLADGQIRERLQGLTKPT